MSAFTTNAMRRWRRRAERGQALISFAFAITAIMAMVALSIDFGLLVTQRRFDQNAADAAALAVARMLAHTVAPVPQGAYGRVYFAATNGQVVDGIEGAELHRGLRHLVDGNRMGAGIASRTTRLGVVEYSADGSTWCYARGQEALSYLPAGAGICSLPTVGATTRDGPPLPSPSTPFHVRVSVSSTTRGFFTAFVGGESAAGGACLRPPGAPGRTTCAQAVAVVAGMPGLPPDIRVGPATLPLCEVELARPGEILELWADNRTDCDGNSTSTGGWKNLLDFTPAGDTAGVRDAWHGAGYEPDGEHPGSGRRDDLVYWIARGFGGTVGTGNFLQTGRPGTAAGPISDGFYGRGRGGSSEEYFFKDARPCTDFGEDYGPQIRCRDGGVIAWDSAQWNTGSVEAPSWADSGGGQPDRVRVAGIYVFRFYCMMSGSGCTERAPRSLVPPCRGASGICGRLVSRFVPRACPECTAGPSVTGNTARLRG